ncbi:ion transporter [Roseicyclus mahoneyensis]|uniref:Voltage-gated potassium channel n=1 Tax=Roseicyclus mahoneyensis TaxID=164332 RepID=A0A316GHA7_9RHOB|nr:ion transporter [Roseicyclus mahoneyensis]PWK59356.1 voltage-gated potassium channel [Roseicyclus mahoneyensis]
MRRAEIIDILEGTHPHAGRGVALAIYALIVVSAVVIAIETMPSLPDGLRAALAMAEIVILAIFALEYTLRLICSPHPLRYALSFWGIIDFIAIVPAIVFLIPDLATVRSLRLLRLLRILKLFKANRALDRIVNAVYSVRAEFGIFLFIAITALYLAAVGIYHFENVAQPDVFSSIPQSLWWAVATLTTVGYGDVYPITAGGRIFTGAVLLIGIGVIAVPAGLITAALTEAGKLQTEPPAPIDPDPDKRAQGTGAQTAHHPTTPSNTEDIP